MKTFWSLNQKTLRALAKVSRAPSQTICSLVIAAVFICSLLSSPLLLARVPRPPDTGHAPSWCSVPIPISHPFPRGAQDSPIKVKPSCRKTFSKIAYQREEAHPCLLSYNAERLWVWSCQKWCSHQQGGVDGRWRESLGSFKSGLIPRHSEPLVVLFCEWLSFLLRKSNKVVWGAT